MTYPTIQIQGNIVAAELLEELDHEAPHQGPQAFGLKSGNRVKDEIARAWSEVRLQWLVFQSKRKRIREGATGASETRQFWVIPLLDALGYRLEVSQRAEVVNGQTYAVSHRDQEVGGFPVHIMGVNDSLDKKRTSGGPRLSPHSLVQEYLNLTEHLYALVTNGIQLRLLRDSSRLTRLSYVEFDLVGMMEEEAYADFAVMYRLLHRTRMPQRMDGGDESVVEQYHQLGLEAGARIREGLSNAVKDGLARLGNALLLAPDNEDLRRQFLSGDLDSKEYYSQLLRLVYRLLFLLVVEERGLVFPDAEPSGKPNPRSLEIYRRYYSIGRLRHQAENLRLTDGSRKDLWLSLWDTFRLFEDEDFGAVLGIKPLVGSLFGNTSVSAIRSTSCPNEVFLFTLDQLCRFRNKQGEWVRVNYAALNVEEFGSVYEGLLEFEPSVDTGESASSSRDWGFRFKEGSERATTGSHYTPDELVRPLIEHALDPVIERRLTADGGSKEANERVLLGLKVCDVACGSGHFLLAAARRIAFVLAKTRTGEEQPAPAALRAATRDVIGHCIYGVDINPMAVELCKVALWLEAHEPGKPLTFLDHRIKCGDAVVGVAHFEDLKEGVLDEAFKTVDGDDKIAAAELRKRNKEERKTRGSVTVRGLQLALGDELGKGVQSLAEQFAELDELGDNSVLAVRKKEARYRELAEEPARRFRDLADVKTAQFFLPKTWERRSDLCTDLSFRRGLGGAAAISEGVVRSATSKSDDRRFFHWFVEFPDVMAGGGFDCILGNPPFLGGQKLSGLFGHAYLNFLKAEYAPAGAIDLVGFFFRRVFSLLREGGTQGQIATNTLAQGSTREGGLLVIIGEGGSINFAVRSTSWPGVAALEVSLVTVHKGSSPEVCLLDGARVDCINSYLSDEEPLGDPSRLPANSDKSFQGSVILGMGFILTPEEAHELIERDPRNAEVLSPYLTGQDLNSRSDQSPSRWAINFRDWPLEKARKYPDCFRIVEERVKPERSKNRRKGRRELWWQYGERAQKLYSRIAGLDRVLTVAIVTKHLGFAFQPVGQVFAHRCQVFAFDDYRSFAVLQSGIHEVWARYYSSTLESRINYSPSRCFDTFPFPEARESEELGSRGQVHYLARQEVMRRTGLGMTKTYNLVHRADLNIADLEGLVANQDMASLMEAIRRVRVTSAELDQAVANSYGWADLDLAHDFHTVDHLRESDNVRYTLSKEARRVVLWRLLELNLAKS